MNKNLLKWILIAAVIIGAAGFLMLSETSSKKEKIGELMFGREAPSCEA